jgi:hypothetical protein
MFLHAYYLSTINYQPTNQPNYLYITYILFTYTLTYFLIYY